MAYGYSRSLTIDHTKVGASDLTNFTVLVSLTHSTLKSVANGGHVNNVDVSGFPCDLVFGPNSAGTSPYTWEIVKYDASAGTIIACVLAPSISHTVDTVFYMPYGDTAVNIFQGGSAGAAYDSNFKEVWHLPDGTTLSGASSAASGHALTNHSAAAVAGKVDGAASFDGTSAYMDVSNSAAGSYGTGAFTYAFWLKKPDTNKKFLGGKITATTSSPNFTGWLAYADSTVAFYSVAGGGTDKYVVGSVAIGDNAWHRIVCVRASDSSMKVYVDGTLDTTQSWGSSNNTDQTAINFGLAFAPAETSLGSTFLVDYFNGLQDEVSLHDTDRSAGWVTADYNNQNSPGDIGSPGFYTVGSEVGGGPAISGIAWFEPRANDNRSRYFRFSEPPAIALKPPAATVNTISGMSWFEPPERFYPPFVNRVPQLPAFVLKPPLASSLIYFWARLPYFESDGTLGSDSIHIYDYSTGSEVEYTAGAQQVTTIPDVTNGKWLVFTAPSNDGGGGGGSYGVTCAGAGEVRIVEAYQPATVAVSTIYRTKFAPYRATDTITTPGYRRFKRSGMAIVADGSETTAGFIPVTGMTNMYAVYFGVTPDAYNGAQRALVWDGG